MTSEHYFSVQPDGPDRRRDLRVRLAGRTCTVQAADGVFSGDRVDKGTAVLLYHAPEPPASGTFLDLGCGWGPIALSLAIARPRAFVHAVDVNPRAVALTRTNAAALGLANLIASSPQDVPADLGLDLIWSNPPIRVGKAVLHEMLGLWLPRLRGGAAAYLVVQRNLGSDSLHRWLSETFVQLQVERLTSVRGYRLLAVRKPADAS